MENMTEEQTKWLYDYDIGALITVSFITIMEYLEFWHTHWSVPFIWAFIFVFRNYLEYRLGRWWRSLWELMK